MQVTVARLRRPHESTSTANATEVALQLPLLTLTDDEDDSNADSNARDIRKLCRRLKLPVRVRASKLTVHALAAFGFFVGILILIACIACIAIYQLYRKESQPSPFLDPSYQAFRRGVAPSNSTFVFPSVEERVKYYMADWYLYKYNSTENKKKNWLDEHLCSEVPYWEPGAPLKKKPYRVDAKNLKQMQYVGWPTRMPWRYFRGHPVDIQTYHLRPNTDCPRYVIQIGDASATATHLDTPYPLLVKSRWSLAEYERRYRDTPKSPPILSIAHVSRHYDHFQETDSYWRKIPWEEKEDKVVWRGATSGTRREILRPFASDSASDSQDWDIGFSYALDIHPEAESMVKGQLSVADMLRHKYLLVLEGWGVASSLKWMLYSNSVVFMAPPTKVSWAMEDKLIPYVHYVPIRSDLSDLQSQLEWARSHDEECHSIMLHSRDYIEKLVTSPQAQRETQEILDQIAHRYHSQFGSLLESCEKKR